MVPGQVMLKLSEVLFPFPKEKKSLQGFRQTSKPFQQPWAFLSNIFSGPKDSDLVFQGGGPAGPE